MAQEGGYNDASFSINDDLAFEGMPFFIARVMPSWSALRAFNRRFSHIHHNDIRPPALMPSSPAGGTGAH